MKMRSVALLLTTAVTAVGGQVIDGGVWGQLQNGFAELGVVGGALLNEDKMRMVIPALEGKKLEDFTDWNFFDYASSRGTIEGIAAVTPTDADGLKSKLMELLLDMLKDFALPSPSVDVTYDQQALATDVKLTFSEELKFEIQNIYPRIGALLLVPDWTFELPSGVNWINYLDVTISLRATSAGFSFKIEQFSFKGGSGSTKIFLNNIKCVMAFEQTISDIEWELKAGFELPTLIECLGAGCQHSGAISFYGTVAAHFAVNGLAEFLGTGANTIDLAVTDIFEADTNVSTTVTYNGFAEEIGNLGGSGSRLLEPLLRLAADMSDPIAADMDLGLEDEPFSEFYNVSAAKVDFIQRSGAVFRSYIVDYLMQAIPESRRLSLCVEADLPKDWGMSTTAVTGSFSFEVDGQVYDVPVTIPDPSDKQNLIGYLRGAARMVPGIEERIEITEATNNVADPQTIKFCTTGKPVRPAVLKVTPSHVGFLGWPNVQVAKVPKGPAFDNIVNFIALIQGKPKYSVKDHQRHVMRRGVKTQGLSTADFDYTSRWPVELEIDYKYRFDEHIVSLSVKPTNPLLPIKEWEIQANLTSSFNFNMGLEFEIAIGKGDNKLEKSIVIEYATSTDTASVSTTLSFIVDNVANSITVGAGENWLATIKTGLLKFKVGAEVNVRVESANAVSGFLYRITATNTWQFQLVNYASEKEIFGISDAKLIVGGCSYRFKLVSGSGSDVVIFDSSFLPYALLVPFSKGKMNVVANVRWVSNELNKLGLRSSMVCGTVPPVECTFVVSNAVLPKNLFTPALTTYQTDGELSLPSVRVLLELRPVGAVVVPLPPSGVRPQPWVRPQPLPRRLKLAKWRANIVEVNGKNPSDQDKKRLFQLYVGDLAGSNVGKFIFVPQDKLRIANYKVKDYLGSVKQVIASRRLDVTTKGAWEELDDSVTRDIRVEIKWAPNSVDREKTCRFTVTVDNKSSPWEKLVEAQLRVPDCPQDKLVYTKKTVGNVTKRTVECKELGSCAFSILSSTSCPVPGYDTSYTADLYLVKDEEATIKMTTISFRKGTEVKFAPRDDKVRASLIEDVLSKPKYQLDVVSATHLKNVIEGSVTYQVFSLRVSGVNIFGIERPDIHNAASKVKNIQHTRSLPVGDAFNIRDVRLDLAVYGNLEVNPLSFLGFEAEFTLKWPIFAGYYRRGGAVSKMVFARGIRNRSRHFADSKYASILPWRYLDYVIPTPGISISAKLFGADVLGVELSDRFERNKERFFPQWNDLDIVIFGSLNLQFSRTAKAKFEVSGFSPGTLFKNVGLFITGAADVKIPGVKNAREIAVLQSGTTASPPPDVSLREVLAQLEGMDVQLPIIGKSVGDFLAPITGLLKDLEDVLSLAGENFEEVIEVAMGLSDDKSTECYRSCGFELGLETDPDAVFFMDLNIDKDFEISSGFDLDLKELLGLANIPADQLDLISNIVDVSGQFDLVVKGSVAFRYKMGMMLGFNTMKPVIMQESGVTVLLSVSIANLNFDANLGPLAVTVTNGELTFDAQFRFGLQEHFELHLGLQALKEKMLLETTGTAKVTLPMDQVPISPPMTVVVNLETLLAKVTKREYVGEIVTFTPDPSSITGSLKKLLNVNPLVILLQNPESLVSGIDGFFGKVQLAVTGAGGLLSTIRIPIVKDKVRSILEEGFINKFRVKVMEKVREVKDAIDRGSGGITENSVAGALAAKMTEGLQAAGVMDSTKKVGVEVRDKQGQVMPGVLDADGNLVAGADMTNADSVEWVADIGDLISLTKGFDFDLGLEDLELGLDVQGDIAFELSWLINLRFGISLSKGFYFAVAEPDEVQVSMQMSFVGLKATGQLLFLQAEVEELQDGTTHVYGGMTIDIRDNVARNAVANQDGLLTFSEMRVLGSDVFVFTPSIVARANLRAEVGIAGSSGMPSFSCDIVAEYGVTFVKPEDKPATRPPTPVSPNSKFLSNGSPEGSITFRDVTLDLGSFMSDLLKPILDKISPIVGPVGEVLGKLSEPIPLLSDMGSGDISFIDLPELIINGILSNGPVRGHVYGLGGYVEMILDIVGIIEALAKVDLSNANGLKLNFGDYVYDIKKKTFAEVGAPRTGGPEDLAHEQLQKADPNPTSKNGLSGLFKRLSSSKYFKMPFLKPQSLLQLLMGRDIDIFTIESPKLDVQLIVEFGFDVDIVAVGFYGLFDFNAQIAAGYDTSGIRRAIEQGKPELALDGFFISDTDIATGTGGVDVPELSLEVVIEASGSVNLGVLRGEASGSIEVSATVDLNDPNGDGKLRISEVLSGGLGEMVTIKTTLCVSIKVKVQFRVPFFGWQTLFTLGFGGCAGGGGGGGGGGDPDGGGNPFVEDKTSTPPPPGPPGGSGGGVPGGPPTLYAYAPAGSNDVNIVVRHISGGPANAVVEIHIEDPHNPGTASVPTIVQVPSLEFSNQEPAADMRVTLINPRIGGEFSGRKMGSDVLIIDYSGYQGPGALTGTVADGVISGYLLGGAGIRYSDFSQVIVKLPRAPRVGPSKTAVSPDCGAGCKAVSVEPTDGIDGDGRKIGNPPAITCDNQFVCGTKGTCVTDAMQVASCDCTSPFVGMRCDEYDVGAPAIATPAPTQAVFECNRRSRNSMSCGNYEACKNLGCTCVVPWPGSCTVCCGMYNPPDPSPKTSCEKKVGTDTCFVTPSAWQKKQILDFTNKVRSDHGVSSIVWDDGMAQTVRDSPGLEKVCTTDRSSFSHEWNLNPNQYGADWNNENRVVSSLSDGGTGKDPIFRFSGVDGEKSTVSWYCAEEGCWDYASSAGGAQNNPPDTEGSENFVQMVSKTNVAMACALCSYNTFKAGPEEYYNVNIVCAFKNDGRGAKPLPEQVFPLACRNGGTWNPAVRRCQCPPKEAVDKGFFAECVGQYKDHSGNFMVECTKYVEYNGYFCGIATASHGDVHFIGPATGGAFKVTRDIHGDDDVSYRLYTDDKHTVTANFRTCFGTTIATCMRNIAIRDNAGLYSIEFVEYPLPPPITGGIPPLLKVNCETIGADYYLEKIPPTGGRVRVVGDVFFKHSKRGNRWIDVELFEDGDIKLEMEVSSSFHQEITFHLNMNFEYLASSKTPQGLAFDPHYGSDRDGDKWNDNTVPFCGGGGGVVIPQHRNPRALMNPVGVPVTPSSVTLDDARNYCGGDADRLGFAMRCCQVGARCDGMHAQCVMDACLLAGTIVNPGSAACPSELEQLFLSGDVVNADSCYCEKAKQAVNPATGSCGSCRSHWYPSSDHLAAAVSTAASLAGTCDRYCHPDVTCGGRGSCNADGMCVCAGGLAVATSCPYYGVQKDGVQLRMNAMNGGSSTKGLGLDLIQMPDVYGQMDVFLPSYPVTAGSTFKVECGSSVMCTFIVVVYHCSPCSSKHNLGFPSTLPASGWDTASCAPKFEIAGEGYPMTAFKKSIANGESLELPSAQTDGSYVAVFGLESELPDDWCHKPKGPSFGSGSGCRCF